VQQQHEDTISKTISEDSRQPNYSHLFKTDISGGHGPLFERLSEDRYFQRSHKIDI
jgi:hypothetical protein